MTHEAAILRLHTLLAAPWLVALPTLAAVDWRATLIALIGVVCGTLATLYGVVVAWEGTALYVVRREATFARQREEIARLNATGGADVQYAAAQDAMIAALRLRERELVADVQRLEAENVALKRRFGTRSADKP